MAEKWQFSLRYEMAVRAQILSQNELEIELWEEKLVAVTEADYFVILHTLYYRAYKHNKVSM